MAKHKIFGLFLLLTLSACKTTSPQPPKEAELAGELTQFNYPKYGVSLEYPTNWIVMDQEQVKFAEKLGSKVLFEEDADEIYEVLKESTSTILHVSRYKPGTINNPFMAFVVEVSPLLKGYSSEEYLVNAKALLESLTPDIEFNEGIEQVKFNPEWSKISYNINKFGQTLVLDVYALKLADEAVLTVSTSPTTKHQEELLKILKSVRIK